MNRTEENILERQGAALNRFWFLAVFVLSFFLFYQPAGAAENVAGIDVSPSIIEEKVDPGQILNFSLRATNLGNTAKDFYVIKRDIRGLTEEGKPIFADEKEKTGMELSSWLNFETGPIMIGGGETKLIPFSISVPKDASPGAHLGSLFLSLVPEKPKETGIAIGYQVATIINLRISGEIKEEALLREFRADKLVYGSPTVKFIAKVENLGNTVIKPRGPVEITDMWGRQTALIKMNDDAAAVLPNEQRRFEVSWQGGKFTFGRYEALLSLSYGDEQKQTIFKSVSFWVLPLKLILIIVGAILALGLLVFIITKIYIRKKLKEYGHLRGGQENPVDKSKIPDAKKMNFPFVIIFFIAIYLLAFMLIAVLVGIFV